MGVSVGDMKGAIVATAVFIGLHTFYNGIKTNILNLANGLDPLFIAYKILRAP
jgi:hypothetical protein